MDLELRRLELHDKLVDILGSKHVYFQPPADIRLVYPCIVYSRDSTRILRADNKPYNGWIRYNIMYITREPDNESISQMLCGLPFCSTDRSYVSDNLYHQTFTVFY